jgi:hypothetical protein
VSRNAPVQSHCPRQFILTGFAVFLLWVSHLQPAAAQSFSLDNPTNTTAHVVIVEDRNATEAFRSRPDYVEAMVRRGITRLTGEPSPDKAWLSLVSTQDVVGLKVYSKPGPNSGTRPAVVAAVAKGLITAGIPPRQIVVWDRDEGDLREAGYFQLASNLQVCVVAATRVGWDETNTYDSPIIGNPVFGDFEFEKKGEGVGRKSFVSKLVSRELTKIINITPLLNNNDAGVCGNLFSLAMGCTDNVLRFENDPNRLATAVPEIYALPAVGDIVVLNLTDALICQYEGGDRGLLHYSSMLNQLRFSRDPVALDALSLKELDAQRRKAKAPNLRPNVELYRNAALLELGVADPARMRIETVR